MSHCTARLFARFIVGSFAGHLAAWLAPVVLAAPQGRLPLEGEWQIAPAPAAPAASGGAASGAPPPSYDRTITVPSAFETALGVEFDGVAWYRRTLPLTVAQRGARVRIEFEAAATAARVLVNGVELGRHLGGWTPFAVEASGRSTADGRSLLRFDGSDVLEVELDEKVGHNTQGFLPIIQPHFGGIWQEVTLCVDRVPTIDRADFWSFGRYDPKSGAGELTARVPWRNGPPQGGGEFPSTTGAGEFPSSHGAGEFPSSHGAGEFPSGSATSGATFVRAPASVVIELFDNEQSIARQVVIVGEGGFEARDSGSGGSDSGGALSGTPGSGARERLRSGSGLVAPDGSVELRLPIAKVEPWAPGRVKLYRLRAQLLDTKGERLDQAERDVGFRSLAVDGTTILWNGAPLQVRGLLHWGYSPPDLAPPTVSNYMHWKMQLLALKRLGFNTLKCCLWVPPTCVYELCDELGILVWQEYPTWHPQMDEAHREEVRREYEEFFALDGRHACVAFRSITCETGHGAELHVVKELFEACKSAVPDTLVVDDSSWIGWQRITDFWDEHPYGNHRWWPQRLADFAKHQEEKGKKPLLLGECMAGDTWFDRAAWDAKWGAEEAATGKKWWRPDCYEAQAKFEEWLTAECGAETVASLLPTSLETALEARKYQIETLRATLPDAGYVVSVARDFAKARMGLWDDLGQPKWGPDDWRWHGDVMLSLRTEGERRAFAGKAVLSLDATCFSSDDHSAGGLPCDFSYSIVTLDDQELALPTISSRVVVGNEPRRCEILFDAPATVSPRAWQLQAGLVGALVLPPSSSDGEGALIGETIGGWTGPGLAENEWKLWQLPPFSDTLPPSVREVDHLDPATLDFLEQGGRVLLKVAGAKHSLKSDGMWWLRGAPFTPPHPVHATVPADMLRELQPFDLDGERVMPWTVLRGQVDPILAFWETHDIPEVRAHLFAFDTRVGKGRLLASCLDTASDAGRYVRSAFARHLADGPAPKRELAPATIAALRGLFAEQRLDLPTWNFTMDPADQGLAAGFAKPAFDASSWRDMPAGSHWENHGDDVKHYTGIAWYRVDFELGAAWAGQPARAVFEGIDDSAIVWLDGREVGRFGDPATQTTIWLETQTAELGPLAPGKHTLTLRVVDHAGAGGLWKPVYLTSGPLGEVRTLLE
ncbi:MAG: hypothetical protein JNL90_11305 [Planctomycetes bacterium]|nr:hypothetical protein [Planctomycetota bacterium]